MATVGEEKAIQADTSLPEKIPFWLDPNKRAIIYQIGVLCMVGLLAWYLVSNTLVNLEKQAISSGFGFLQKESSFEIGESLISYSAASTYGRALIVGALNTLKVAFIGIVITLILGTILGVARLSTNWLVSKIAAIYIEVMQDIPVLLQLFFWYAIFYESLPSPRQALNPIYGLFLCNRGVVFAVPESHPAHKYMFLALIVACVVVYLIRRWAKKRQEQTGQIFPIFRVSVAIILGFPLGTWFVFGAPTTMDVPQLVGFNFKG
ncbi:MAG: ABC transporter permease subunit, partial [Desulfobacterales bacterium]